MRDNLKVAIRSLRSSKSFSIAALIVLALAIGASTALFSIVDAVVLRGLPFDEHDRLVAVGDRPPQRLRVPGDTRDPDALSATAPQNYLDWAAQKPGGFRGGHSDPVGRAGRRASQVDAERGSPRWQMATGTTLLEGWLQWVLLAYLLLFSG